VIPKISSFAIMKNPPQPTDFVYNPDGTKRYLTEPVEVEAAVSTKAKKEETAPKKQQQSQPVPESPSPWSRDLDLRLFSILLFSI
jgi:hypothetical protein